MYKPYSGIIFLCLLLTVFVLTNCAPAPGSAAPSVTTDPTRAATAIRQPRVTPSPTARRQPTLFVSASITGTLRAALLNAGKQLTLNAAQNKKSADVVIDVQRSPGAQPLTERLYAVADWFPTPRVNIGSEDLLNLWQGTPTADGITTLLMSPETLSEFAELWGKPAPNVSSVPADQLVQALWANHAALALMPFDRLVPKVKALRVDDLDLLDRNANLDAYPLVARTFISGDATYVKGITAALAKNALLTNRDPNRMTKLIMTGVTAISRTSAFKIDAAGDPALPARVVADVLSAADLTMVSNETPFTKSCKPELGTLRLCGKPEYIEALKLAGVDLISSTGNHMNDYGIDAFRETLDLFDANGFKVYGGGRNDTEASRVLVVEDHGNKLAFLGMNSFGPVSVWATADRPGAQKYDADKLHQELVEARQNADVVFLDMQADETYQYEPDANNQEMFRDGIANGADVVTGVQAHQPQAIEFTPDGKQMILYGLGNLFFDQMQSDNVRQGLVVRHTIYDGKLVQTELLPTMLENYVQPRWATPAEAREILKLVFDASKFK
jgi:poly-gamma-glutamate capsule biosynthesis protein CapA/YwtB (metallophosphatase superfamily)